MLLEFTALDHYRSVELEATESRFLSPGDVHHGAFVAFFLSLIHMNRGFVPDAAEFYHVGQEIAVQVVSIDRTKQPPEVRVQVTTAEMARPSQSPWTTVGPWAS